jgi:6-pyruvoyltetrahydropterin/6-carboxytetrahydropterin synthase
MNRKKKIIRDNKKESRTIKMKSKLDLDWMNNYFQNSYKYAVTKRLSIPIGHRLSKNTSLCQHLHGHNLILEVTCSAAILDENDMVIDFHDLKREIQKILDNWDHALIVNSKDRKNLSKYLSDRVIFLDVDPTAEVLCRYLFDALSDSIGSIDNSAQRRLQLESVTIWENDSGYATYCREGWC